MTTLDKKAAASLDTLCSVKPNRRTGSAGNRRAVDFFAGSIRPFGFELDLEPFDCLDYHCQSSSLVHAGRSFDVHVSPYSLGCSLQAQLVAASSVEDLQQLDCSNRVLLMHGEICSEQVMPKNFVFYNPDHHRQLIALLEEKAPAALVTATGRNPEMVGALDPFPLFVDGDFDLPSLYCRESVGRELLPLVGETVHLEIDARRIPSVASNGLARLNPHAGRKIVVSAHIDAYEDSPGALDNASGVTVLLLLAELLAGYPGSIGVDLVAFNGEDHYSAAGQMDYLRRYAQDFPSILLNVNLDDLGFREGVSAFSFFECPPDLERDARQVFAAFPGLVPGAPWYQGDHMIFVQKGIPALAFTSQKMPDLMRTLTHTAADTPANVDVRKLVEVARALDAFIRSL